VSLLTEPSTVLFDTVGSEAKTSGCAPHNVNCSCLPLMAVSVVRQPCTVYVLNTLIAVPIQLDRWYVRCSEVEGTLVETSASGQPRCFAFWQEFSKVSLPLLVYSATLVLICLTWNSATPMRTSRVTAVHSRTTTSSVYTTRRRCVSHPVFPTSISLTAACPFLLSPCGPHQ
jgi:hypothetical protein